MIRAVTFDLWQTLIVEIPEANLRRTPLRVAAAVEMLRVPKERVEAAHEEVWKRMEERWRTDRDYSLEEQVRLFAELAGAVDVPPQLLQTYADALLLHPPDIDPAAAKVLELATRRGLRVGLISNSGRTPGATMRKLLDSAGLLRHFHATVFSNESILRKPDPEIFRRTLETLGVAAADAVHVGDSADHDVKGGKGAGMKTIHLSRSASPLADHGAETLEQVAEILGRL